MLDRVEIARPCHMSWHGMTGDDRVRHCAACDKSVYNLSAMTRDEAEALLAEHEGSICLQLYRRADGTVITSDCPVGAESRQRHRLALAGVAASAIAAGAAGAALWQLEPPLTETEEEGTSDDQQYMLQHYLGAGAVREVEQEDVPKVEMRRGRQTLPKPLVR